MFYSIILDSNGNGSGVHSYVEQPSSYPSNEIKCTEEQSKTPMQWQVSNGNLVANLSVVQAAQSVALKETYKENIKTCTVTLNGSTYIIDTTNMSQLLLDAFVAQNAPTATYSIELADGSYATLSGSDLIQAVTQIHTAIHTHKQQLIGLLGQVKQANNANNIKQVKFGG